MFPHHSFDSISYCSLCFFSGKLPWDSQGACNSFRCQSKANNIYGQQREQFLPVFFIKSEGPVPETPQQTSTHVSLARIVSHAHENPLTGKGNDSTLIGWKGFQPLRAHQGWSSRVS